MILYAVIVIAALLLLWMIYLLVIMPAKVDKSQYPWFDNFKYAHRGLFTHDQVLPENSLGAFKNAVDNGYGMELDIQISADDQIYVFHDSSLKRMTGIDATASSYTYPELKKIKLGNSDVEKIPLFSEVLELVGGKTPIIIELKKTERYKELCSKALEMLRDYKGHYCIESFDPRIVKWFKDNAPDILRGQLSYKYKKFKNFGDFVQKFLMARLLTNIKAKPHFIAYKWDDMDSLSLRLCKKLGAYMVCWTVKTKEGWKRTEPFFDAIIFEMED